MPYTDEYDILVRELFGENLGEGATVMPGLTGVCFDNDALDPLAYFCFGTYWDEDKQARLQSHVRTISADDCNTVRGILRDCVESLFKAAENDWRDQESEEYFRDFCEANEWEFTEDGDRWLRKEATTRTASA